MTAKFIVIEGLEGSGKSTAIKVVETYLQGKGLDIVKVREPGGTPVAESLRAIIKQNHDEMISSETELLIMYAARSQLVKNVINPAMENGQWVLSDRHDMSSKAYQGGGRGLSMSTINTLSDIVLGELRPDLTIYLDIPAEIGLERARGRGELDRIEQEQISFFEQTREAYLSLADADPNCTIVDAAQSMQAVHKDILSALDTFFGKYV